MKRYEGQRLGHAVRVTVNGRPLDPRLDLRNHSPTGFEWGYSGSGPTQLALAILADLLQDDEQALRRYQRFKEMVIAGLPKEGWTMTETEIREVLCRLRT